MEDLREEIANEVIEVMTGMFKKEITYMMTEVLDYVQVAVDDKRFKPLRSKILRIGNNAIRKFEKEKYNG